MYSDPCCGCGGLGKPVYNKIAEEGRELGILDFLSDGGVFRQVPCGVRVQLLVGPGDSSCHGGPTSTLFQFPKSEAQEACLSSMNDKPVTPRRCCHRFRWCYMDDAPTTVLSKSVP
jgi:hypothetical protein